jgi:pimeloyl-ACP methyl ester carboxylesterase
MTVVFVHGALQTRALWDDLRGRLDAESIALPLPGFGCARPPGFGAGKDDYAEWLAEALEQIEAPIDLVGHDLGALLSIRVASAFDVPLHSWAADLVSVFHPAYEWHRVARIWQTPGEGERWLATSRAAAPGSTMSAAGRLALLGVPEELALRIGRAHDETMSGCMLDLYRSCVPNLAADWGGDLDGTTAAPGLVLVATANPFDDLARSAEMAARVGARVARLDGLAHCWMAEDPHAGAAALLGFWASLGRGGRNQSIQHRVRRAI